VSPYPFPLRLVWDKDSTPRGITQRIQLEVGGVDAWVENGSYTREIELLSDDENKG
jgi:hypothetical protein